MKRINKFSIAYKNVIHNKKNILGIFLLVICFILIIFSLSAYKSFNIMLFEAKNNFFNQSFWIDYRNAETADHLAILEKVSKIDHVVAAYPKEYFETSGELEKLGDKEIEGNVVLYGLNEKVSPKIVSGRRVQHEGEIVCPVIFYPFDDLETNNDIDRDSIINMKKYLNKQVILNTENGEMSFKLVGVYKNELTDYDENKCYIMFSDVEKIENLDINKIIIFDEENKAFYFPKITIDDLDNVDYVRKELAKMDITLIEAYGENKSFIVFAKAVMIAVIIICVITSLTILIIMNSRYIDKNKYNIALLKVFGYKAKDIFDIVFYENVIINYIAIFVSMIISLIVYIILNVITYFKPYYFDKMTFFYSYLSLIFCLVIALVISYFSLKMYKKGINNLNPINELKE